MSFHTDYGGGVMMININIATEDHGWDQDPGDMVSVDMGFDRFEKHGYSVTMNGESAGTRLERMQRAVRALNCVKQTMEAKIERELKKMAANSR